MLEKVELGEFQSRIVFFIVSFTTKGVSEKLEEVVNMGKHCFFLTRNNNKKLYHFFVMQYKKIKIRIFFFFQVKKNKRGEYFSQLFQTFRVLMVKTYKSSA